MKFITRFFNRRRIFRLIIENLILLLILVSFIVFSYFNVNSLPKNFQIESKNSTILGKIKTGKFITIEQDNHFRETWRVSGTPFYINKTLIVWIHKVELLASKNGISNRKNYLIFDDLFIIYDIEQYNGNTIVTDSNGNIYNIKEE